MARRYVLLDVFTQTALSGNPLAVILDSEGLSDAQMQAIAAEFNLSETVFVHKAENPAHSAALRIFTPDQELPFAGHPTVGTAVLLAGERFGDVSDPQNAVVVLEEKAGTIRCGVTLKGNGLGFAEFDTPKTAAPSNPLGDKDLIAAALGVEPTEIGFENYTPCSMDAGLPFALVPVRNLEVMRRLKPNAKYWDEAFGSHAHNNAFIYCRETVNSASHFHARMLFIDGGYLREDAATGSAVAAFAGAIARYDDLPEGIHRIQVEQGYEMDRPSLIELEIEMLDGKIKAERVGGNAVIVGRGELFL